MPRPAEPATGRPGRRTQLAVAIVVSALTVSACTGGSEGDGDRPGPTSGRSASSGPLQPMTWTAERTLPGVRPGGVTTDPLTGTTYVGGSVPATAASSYSGPLIKGGTRKPVLWVRTGPGSWRQARLQVTSFYGAQSTLASVSADQRVVALGAVAGGAHANPRPSFFVGTASAVAEREQGFYVYGGENAVGIVGMAAGPRTLLMVGQWAPDGHRASGALWTSRDGVRYVRHDAIPGLADSLGGQRTTSPQAAASLGDRFLVVGSITDLTKPTLSVEPAAWTTDGSSVTTDALPVPGGQLGGPTALACARPDHVLPAAPTSAGSCVAAGLLTAQGRDVLAAWTIGVLDRAIESRLIDVSACRPPAAAPDPGESTPRPPRVRVSTGLGPSWIVVATSAAGVACRVDGQRAVPVALPSGCVPVAVQAPQSPGGTGSLICADAEGVTTYRQR